MTKRERIIAALNHEMADRVPLFDLIANTAIVERVMDERLTYENNKYLISKATEKLFDMTRWVEGYDRPRIEKDDQGFTRQHAEWTSWVIDRPFKTSEEAAGYIDGQIELLKNQKIDINYKKEHNDCITKPGNFLMRRNICNLPLQSRCFILITLAFIFMVETAWEYKFS